MALSREDRAERVLDALRASGFDVELESGLGDRPLRVAISTEAGRSLLRVFGWAATPGGPPGVRADTEYRVQTTRPGGVPFAVAEDSRTLLLGHHEDLHVFAAWPVAGHPNPGSSSSLQVSEATLEEAASDGFAAQPRT